jgi:glycosyltransferase involved in cell wall biosynthesis
LKQPSLTGHAESLGVSIVICCHNSEKLLPRTIAHLKQQQVSDEVKWEVLVIDNASIDATASVATQCWRDNGPAPMRVVHEPRLGLSYARERAFHEAQYELVSFIDDDNWVDPEWVMTASRCMSADSRLGALGSANTAVADVPIPAWFSRYCHYYAAWNFSESATVPTRFLTGAGMTIRKSAWFRLRQNEFRLHLTGRCGTRLLGLEDIELGFALQLTGWKIGVEPRLKLNHYMPPQRLRWTYLRRLIRGAGESQGLLDAYTEYSISLAPGARSWMSDRWWYQIRKPLRKLVRRPRAVIAALATQGEGRAEVIEVEELFGRAIGLLRHRGRYGAARRAVREASRRYGANHSC